jgi:hypothetical protein
VLKLLAVPVTTNPPPVFALLATLFVNVPLVLEMTNPAPMFGDVPIAVEFES